MIGSTNHIKVTVIRNAAGISPASVNAGCRPRATTYPNVSLKLPSGCGSNTRDLYDPSKSHTIRQIMNFYNAPATSFVPYLINDLDTELDLNCKLESGDHLIVIWAPIAQLRKELING